jgi:hypothetical protein
MGIGVETLLRQQILGITINTDFVIPGVAAMKTFSLKLPPSLSAKLNRLAKKRGQTKSEIVREALEQFFNGERTIPPGSALEAAGPWIGCVEGPGDLSTNPKYMEGFGE